MIFWLASLRSHTPVTWTFFSHTHRLLVVGWPAGSTSTSNRRCLPLACGLLPPTSAWPRERSSIGTASHLMPKSAWSAEALTSGGLPCIRNCTLLCELQRLRSGEVLARTPAQSLNL